MADSEGYSGKTMPPVEQKKSEARTTAAVRERIKTQELNPFTAAASTISGMNNSGMHLQTLSIFFAPVASTFTAVCFDENPLTRQCVNEGRNSSGFQILYLYCSFSSDVMAVKGLKTAILIGQCKTCPHFSCKHLLLATKVRCHNKHLQQPK